MPGKYKVNAQTINGDAQPAVRGRSDPGALAKLFDQWMQEDIAEQKQTFEYLRQALDKGRPSGYKLFS
jgi:hypothetical protein